MTGPDVKFTREFFLYSPRQERVYPVAEADWERIKRRINAMVPVKRTFAALSSFFGGVCGSGIVALLGLYGSQATVPAWVKPATLALTGATGLMTWAFHKLDGQQKVMVTTTTDDVVAEMLEIEERFKRAEADARKVAVLGAAFRRIATLRQRGPFTIGGRVVHEKHGYGVVRRIYALNSESPTYTMDVEFDKAPGNVLRFPMPDAALKPAPP